MVNVIRRLFQLVVALSGAVFVVLGVRWLVDPTGSADFFGFELAQGLGRSSQIGDLSALFLTIAICTLTALTTGRRTWYWPPIILLTLVAAGRLIAWVQHDAALARDMIAIELAVVLILLLAAWLLAERGE